MTRGDGVKVEEEEEQAGLQTGMPGDIGDREPLRGEVKTLNNGGCGGERERERASERERK